MSKSPPLNKLIDIMKELHSGQYDKTGIPYYQHPLRVMEICKLLNPEASFNTLAIALLHDVIEDVPDGLAQLEKVLKSYDPIILESCKLLTRPAELSYTSYVQKVFSSGNEAAILVKKADILDHLERIHLITDPKLKSRLMRKYAQVIGG